jgi:hypothetical protein
MTWVVVKTILQEIRSQGNPLIVWLLSTSAIFCSLKVVLRFAAYTGYLEQRRQESQSTKGEHNAAEQGTTVQ